MKIKKLSHCCLVIETKGRKILLDPGIFSLEEHRKVKAADIVLITHEHGDHFHIESLKELIKRTPGVIVITNDAVGDILAKEGITHRVMKHGDAIDVKDIHIEAYGKDHAIMHSSIPLASNVGYFIQGESPTSKFFFPGDAFTDPKKPIDVLALPIVAPWMKLSEAIDYALQVKPRLAFPVHDAISIGMGSLHALPERILAKNGIEFIKMEDGGTVEVP